MIHKLSRVVKILFHRVSIERLLSNNEEKQLYFDELKMDYVQDLLLTYYQQYSDTEIFMHITEIQRQMELNTPPNSLHVFGLLFYYAHEILVFHENRVACRYDRLLEWNKTTTAMGEDLLILSFLVSQYKDFEEIRFDFSWPPVIGHNNGQLNRILQKGMADNHFHLRVSSPVFHLSWLNLMNHPMANPLYKDFEKIENNYRDKNKKSEVAIAREPLSVLAVQASLIRLYLCSRLVDFKMQLGKYHISVKDLVTYMVQNRNTYLDLVKILSDASKIIQPGPDPSHVQTTSKTISIKRLLAYIRKHHAALKSASSILAFFELFKQQTLKFPVSDDIRNLNFLEEQLAAGTDNAYIGLEQCRQCLDRQIFENIWSNKTMTVLQEWLEKPYLCESNASFIQTLIDSVDISLNAPDYMLAFVPEKWIKNVNYRILAGERWFIYSMLKNMFTSRNHFSRKEFNLFYAYLRIQNEIRYELLQVNELVGFENFQIYQKRKDLFTGLWSRDSEKMLTKLAVNDVLANPAMRYLELRISPCKTARENAIAIHTYDQAILESFSPKLSEDEPAGSDSAHCPSDTLLEAFDRHDLRNRFYYVYHFPKAPDKESFTEMECRHYMYRKRLLQKAEEIIKFRRDYPWLGRRVFGIDACSQEIGCRPEVFATVFRTLKNHIVSDCYDYQEYELPQLKITYHVGEDFLDLPDGLRAIDEAIRFFNMDCDDRLGHAIALGIDPHEWYSAKKGQITIRLQDYLDNIVWLHHALSKYHISDMSAFEGWLEKQYSYYFNYIYGSSLTNIPENALSEFSIYTYYFSWLLRGDDPELYKERKFKNCPHTSLMDQYTVSRRYRRKDDIRNIFHVTWLYHMYHYDEHVKKRGWEEKTFQVSSDYIKAVTLVQKALREDLVKKGISIETNPSSNFRIGTISKYKDHPIKTFYNLGLTKNEQELMSCAQINVSINTDDKGLFATRLENEYAYLARALEKEVNPDGSSRYKREFIYKWLDHIREMGLRQAFGNCGLFSGSANTREHKRLTEVPVENWSKPRVSYNLCEFSELP